MDPVFNLYAQGNVIDVLANAPNLFLTTGNHVKMKLFVNDFTPNINSIIADFTEATFTGYAAATLPAGVEGLMPDGRHQLAYRGIAPILSSGEPGTPTVVYGWYIINDVVPWLVMAKRFDNPIAVHLGTVIPLEAAFVLPASLSQPDGIST